MGPKGFYLINEAKNANAVVRTSGHLSSDALIYMAMKQLDAVSAKDIKKYEEDTSSRYQVGGPGVSEKAQVWAPIHRLFTDHLASKTGVETLQGKFCEMFSETLHRQPKGEWKEVRLYQFLQAEMARCAIIAIAGTEILDLNPGFVEAMWRFDENVYPMALSVPRLFYGKPYKARDKFHDMGEKWLAIVSEKYDWSGPDVDWEPLFGTRYLRSHAKLLMDRDFDLRSKVGLLLGGVWAYVFMVHLTSERGADIRSSSNANSIPMTGWLMIHLIQDKALFDAVREAVRSSVIIDPKTGKMNLDMTKLIDVPLLQSLYTETLRMHVSINITREVMQDMNLDGYTLKKGYLVQTPSHIAHFDESIWTDADHPTTEFWAERHIKYVDEVDDTGKVKSVPTFSTQGRSGGYFPYGMWIRRFGFAHANTTHYRRRWELNVSRTSFCEAGNDYCYGTPRYQL